MSRSRCWSIAVKQCITALFKQAINYLLDTGGPAPSDRLLVNGSHLYTESDNYRADTYAQAERIKSDEKVLEFSTILAIA